MHSPRGDYKLDCVFTTKVVLKTQSLLYPFWRGIVSNNEDKMFATNLKNRADAAIQPAYTGSYLIDLQEVEKEYHTPAGKFIALKGINLQVKSGNFISVIGKSGSGKSTLINMLTGIDRPSRGKMFINGAAIHEMNEEQISIWRGTTIGIVFQFFQLLPTLTAIENILLAMDLAGKIAKKDRPEKALQILEHVGMADYVHALPGDLSGGQQQVIAIARSLANDPPIITADEPTGNLDVQTANSVFKLFEQLADDGKTVLMVTHDNELANRAWRSIVIADGQIVDEKNNR
jgi:putative ABC transport system ATP-binding protein